MMLRRVLTGLLAVSLLGTSLPAHAQNATSEKCITDTYTQLLKEQLFFRSTVFGQKTAEQLHQGGVRYDGQIKPWIKTGQNEWKTFDSSAPASRTNAQVEAQAFPPKRRGLLEVKKALSSEQLPLVLQSMRALQCRLRSVCALAIASRNPGASTTIRVQPDGCIAQDLRRIDSCSDDPAINGNGGTLSTIQVGVCDAAVNGILDREASVLMLVMSYDASYRGFAQFAGIMQGFSDGLRVPILQVLTNTVELMRKLGNAPCFSAQCDE